MPLALNSFTGKNSMPQQTAPTLARRLVGNLTLTFAAISVLCAVLVMATLYLSFERSMEHETSEALSHFGQEISNLRKDLLFHSHTLGMVAGWSGEEGEGNKYAEALDEHLNSWFRLSGVELVGTAAPEDWKALGYDLSVFSEAVWSRPQVVLHSKKAGEAELDLGEATVVEIDRQRDQGDALLFDLAVELGDFPFSEK